jgi:ATP-independent RNA helicase DbpA
MKIQFTTILAISRFNLEKNQFEKLALSPALLSVIEELKYTQMTPIQAQSIPILLKGEDLIGQSKTGSGKTAAFALPILNKIKVNKSAIQALIICPTRELAAQVVRETRTLGRRLIGLKVLVLTGGQSGRDQTKSLSNGAHIIVGTPGRLLDHINREHLDLNDIKTLILDEADKMLEMGFEDDIRSIISFLPNNRQTALFSATFPEGVEVMSKRYQKNPKTIKIENIISETSGIESIAYETEVTEKLNTLMRVLQTHPSKSTLIFCNMKSTVNEILEKLLEQDASAAALHGDLDQRARDQVMAKFRNNSLRILVATDVAARGLDIDHLELVINYDLPLQADTYVHRIGRTGRAGRSGVAVSLATQRDELRLIEFEKAAGKKIDRKKLGFKNQLGIAKELKESQMKTLFISGGRKDKLRPGDILGALTSQPGGLIATDIGKIEIHDKFSYVAVSSQKAKAAMEKLRADRIKGHKYQIRPVNERS